MGKERQWASLFFHYFHWTETRLIQGRELVSVEPGQIHLGMGSQFKKYLSSICFIPGSFLCVSNFILCSQQSSLHFEDDPENYKSKNWSQITAANKVKLGIVSKPHCTLS